MSEEELHAKIVQSGTWQYDGVPTQVWIVRQNFESLYEPDFDDRPEELNEDGEAFQVVFARNGQMITLGPTRLSQPEAITAANEVVSTPINWTNDFNRELRVGPRYSIEPLLGQ